MLALGYIGSLLYGVLCLAISMVAYKLGLPKKYTRKIVHILVGFEWVILYHTLGVGIHFIAVCLIFTTLLAVTYKKSLMPMISSESDNAPGTVYYGISMTVMAIASCFIEGFVFAFGIAVFCTSIGDGMAGVIGSSLSKINPKIYKNKSLIGTLSAFAFSFVSIYVFGLIYDLNLKISYALAIALLASGLELITEYGLDNITLPLGVATLSYLLLFVNGTVSYIIPIILTPFVVAFAIEKRILTKKGVAFALLLDLIVSFALGNFGFVLLLEFLLLSVAVDKLKKYLKKTKDEISKRGEHRDEIQVLSNGIIPALMALLYWASGNYAFIVGYNVALAEAFSDTCASGIGGISQKAFDPFKMKKVPSGLSGGMSIPGTLASVIAPFIFLLVSVAFGIIDFKVWALCAAFAAAGAIFDSFIGSVFQCKFRCNVCGIITEKNIHCETDTKLVSGFRCVTNDVVNLVSALISSILSIIVYISTFL